MQFLSAAFFFSTFARVLAENRYYDFVATPIVNDDLSPDCYSKRPMFLINGEFPGPTIEADEGDMIHLQLTNNHPSETLTIHFHGIHQKGTVYSDGVAGVTQCGLPPYQSQNLTFAAGPSGTHYWHGHQSLLIGDGISGPLIVHESAEKDVLEYDEELLVFLQDWYHTTSTNQRTGLDSEPFVWIGNPQTNLINGKGAYDGCEAGGDMCLDTCSDKASLLEQLVVEEGKTYRLRIINSAQLLPFNFAIAGHNLTIIEADGTLIEPVKVSYLDISPGQRYSVLLTANQPVTNTTSYWIRTIARGREVEPTGMAYLTYGKASALPAEGTEPIQPVWDDPIAGPALDASLLTKDPSSYPEYSALETTNPTTTLIMVGTQARVFETNLLRWAVNNVSNTPEPEPLIVKARRTAQENKLGALEHTSDIPETPPTAWNHTELVDSEGGPGIFLEEVMPLVLRAQKGDVIDIVMQNSRALNGAAEVHPWHMHGHAFWIIGQGTGTFNPETDPANFNLVNPVLRDTFTLWPLGWTAIRVHATNPGVWEFHCHILSHAVMGMGLSIIVSAEEVDAPPPGAMSCTEGSLEAGNVESDSTSAAYQPAIASVVAVILSVLVVS